QEMTIVLQHQFWDLGITEHTFEVGLSFSGVPERLLIPFDALTGFFDPSVQFGLKFEVQDDKEEEEAAPQAPTRPTRGASEPTELQPKKPTPVAAKPSSAKLTAQPTGDAEKSTSKAEKPAKAEKPEKSGEKDEAASAEV